MSGLDDATAQECWGGVGWCPRMVCFANFDFEMCFTPQRRALFRHLNFQKWSENGCALYILTWKCASRHGVQFFISHLASWLCTRRFSEPTFFLRSGAANHWKNTVFCDFGTGVAFAPEPCWVAFAPEWSAMKWVQGRMWPSFRGECDPCFCVAGAIVSEPQKDFFHPRESYSRVMRRSNSHFNQLPGHYGCYGVPLLRCNIHFEQLRRCFGCYVPTAISINFQHAMDATL